VLWVVLVGVLAVLYLVQRRVLLLVLGAVLLLVELLELYQALPPEH
jgi:hypothetical protein